MSLTLPRTRSSDHPMKRKYKFFKESFPSSYLKRLGSIVSCYIAVFYYLVACITYRNWIKVFEILFFFIVGIPFLGWKLSEKKVQTHSLLDPQSLKQSWHLPLCACEDKDHILNNFFSLMPSTVSGHKRFPLIYRFI